MKKFLALICVLGFSAQSSAYFAQLDSGEVVKEYRVGLGPQFILNNYDGVNFLGNLDIPVNDEQSIRAIMGAGKVDFQIGGFYKWVPFPDTKSQPALGGSLGVVYGKIGGISETSLRVHPTASKKLRTEVGDIVPYVALPTGFTTRSGAPNDNGTFVPVQFVGGAEMSFLNLPKWSFFAELGLNVTKAFSYIALNANYSFQYGKK